MSTDEIIIRSYVTGKPREFLIAHPEWQSEKKQEKQIEDLLQRRNRGEPLAYILGFKEFYGRRFKVSPDVLIPRPETENLIDVAISLRPKKILDIGTGSGCIAITLALELPESVVTGVDISDKALNIAKNNSLTLQTDVNFMKSDLLDSIKDYDYDLIVANLPYVDKEWDWIDESLKYEPNDALFASDGGLELIKRLICESRDYFKKSNITDEKYLLLEADPCQHKKIAKFAKNHGFIEKSIDDASEYTISLKYCAND